MGEYYQKNKERINRRNREYYRNNKEKILKQQKEYRNKNSKKIKEYYEKNKKRFFKRVQKYHQENRKRINEQKRGYWQKGIEQENQRRIKLGLPFIGEGFKKEMELLVYIHSLFGNYEIFTHHRKTLEGLELDIYIPELKLAFEYMGKQHYEWIDYFHKTKEEFELLQYRDKCKKKICKIKGITLIRIRYDEKLSEQLVLTKLNYLKGLNINQEKLK